MSIVRVRGLSKEYRQGDVVVRALRGVDLDIEAGELIALMGPSGSGKTTLLNLIGALDEPSGGSVVVDEQDLAAMSKRERSRMRLCHLGFVFQAYNLIPVMTAYENAEFVLLLRGVDKRERSARVQRILQEVGLGGLEDRWPHELSGGQQQRVAVARALAGEPALVLADEPTANLDSRTGHALIDTMKEMNERSRATFVFATHDPQVMEHARRVVRLVDGRVVEDRRQ